MRPRRMCIRIRMRFRGGVMVWGIVGEKGGEERRGGMMGG